MGKLGRQRTFIVVPKASEQLRIPTDLTGVTLGRFDPNRNDKNLEAAFGPFCNMVRGQIRAMESEFFRRFDRVRNVTLDQKATSSSSKRAMVPGITGSTSLRSSTLLSRTANCTSTSETSSLAILARTLRKTLSSGTGTKIRSLRKLLLRVRTSSCLSSPMTRRGQETSPDSNACL